MSDDAHGSCADGAAAVRAEPCSAPVLLAPTRTRGSAPAPYQAQSDEALMVAYCGGDAIAFRVLYGRHRSGLYRFLLRQSGAAAIAEELFQDVWTSVIGARKRYAARASFATYLYKIAHNRLIDHFRRSAHRPSVHIPDGHDFEVEQLEARPMDRPDVRFQTGVQIQRFTEILAGLPSEQREAFVMHQEAGFSIDQIASATGVSYETAKSRLRYALAKLRRGLKEVM